MQRKYAKDAENKATAAVLVVQVWCSPAPVACLRTVGTIKAISWGIFVGAKELNVSYSCFANQRAKKQIDRFRRAVPASSLGLLPACCLNQTPGTSTCR